ncbi:MAG: NAD(P)/FAD-dependent oxidoreductase [Clostridiales bacterium]|uniref:NAD(P)/FAD-dependent oxidoreductase n=1 Tax=Intestinimonas massiliensis (ex Afouda et al. 2020) TaxID=1673721 RepID=A0AAW5JK50_9FIRM|nr:NAD(P)/FAD-dependent oxidoreductase [Intestinimonas massiliensis (ex Afouda et al. 2020)]MCG4527386.1 NAD(P)/FAD-dependent oxidoreductase [Intestinimonas massiliensis (ex Afouda et al. 2020)]MCQ4770561.1 NAD(P)/FAD-dependent oxidoreductase [Intestinimonas massiliensis (ex Afouda et al. 2020)]MCQ4805239.1 NAD(P)/FAD-dependent oxidoreductase [Intestinimonas massiliensis (ex Afouda et al. 2020)]MDU1325783.1 NAD(P)/FAD-dependent oxidoreductase [Clostridiales bacterium]
MYDIAVIGGGPAGLSAAVNARARNKSVLVVTNDYRESPLYKAEWVDNYLGMPGRTGPELLEAYHSHAEAMGTVFRAGRALNIMPMEGTNYIGIGSDMEEARAVILATGVSRGRKYPGEAEFLGRGVSYCATCDGMLYRNRPVAVVGLAPDAPEEANFLHGLGCRVTYVSPRAPAGLDPAIPYVKAARMEITGSSAVSALQADGREIPCDGVFLLRHAVAPTDLLPGLTLEGGYVAVDRDMRTSLPGIFACGDCTGEPLQLSKAAGEGLIAGQKAAEYVDALHTDKTNSN